MSVVQSSVVSRNRRGLRTGRTRSPLDLRTVLGLGLLGLGIGMLCLGIFHGFAHGSCSTTGYSGNYGPVPTCAKGIGWWMLMLMAGIVVAGVGAVLASSLGGLIVPLVFVAIGAPFIALAFGSHGHLLFNASSGSGKIFSAAFGGAFVLSGLIWGAFAARNVTGVSSSTILSGLVAAAVGVGAAFALASGVSSAIGKTTTPSSVQVAPGVTVLSPAAWRLQGIAICKDQVAAQRLLSSSVKASLTAECQPNFRAAERQLPVAARKAAIAYTTARCRQATQATAAANGSGFANTLGGACANPAQASQGGGLKSLQARLCVQVVKAQVPVADQKQALAACAKL